METRPAEPARPAFTVLLDDGKRHEFETQEAFDTFIAGTHHRESVERTRHAAGRAKQPKDADVQALKKKTDKIARELDALARRAHLPPNSRELFARATVERLADEPAIFDATLLFQGAGFSGTAVPVYGDLFDLGYLGAWPGRVRSLLSDRSLTLYSQTGFRGLQYWIFAPQGSYAAVYDLGWFNGLATSLQYQR
jgi:hypothetical protein